MGRTMRPFLLSVKLPTMGLRTFASELLPSALQGAKRNPPQPTNHTTTHTYTFAELSTKLHYLSRSDLKQVREAYKFADQAHLGQFRASGEPYITHPLAVAGLCADWRLDVQGIMAALMHDAMEDCNVTKTELIERFGSATADLVDGLTKLDKLQFSTREESQAESFRKMLLAMTRDVRVILIKLADRLHNMRTMTAMAAHKRGRIAQETLDIYAPIAHRLGLNTIFCELQDLSFSHLHPWRYATIAKAVQRSRGYRRDIIDRINTAAQDALAKAKVTAKISGREKNVYSIYRKMREKHSSFAHINDLFGFRVIVTGTHDCYLALGVLHQLYKPMPGRFKDYIAIPKANGYQSLHTTLVSPLGTAIEFQIRSDSMNAVADSGIAAHWMYKGKEIQASEAQRLGAMWLKSLIDIQDNTRDSSEFLEHIKIDLAPDSVYVFTPKSRILALPRGATPIDFAYAIHSDIGHHCTGALINGEPVALNTTLRSGDVVSITTGPSANPNPIWLNYASTGRARSRIRHYLKTQEQEESHALGERMLMQALRAEGMVMPEHNPDDKRTNEIWLTLLRWSGNRSRHDLLIDIGLGRKLAAIVAKRLAHLLAEKGLRPDPITLSLSRYSSEQERSEPHAVLLNGTEGASVKYASCCRPIPGDALIGHMGRGEGLIIHTAECKSGRKNSQREGTHWIEIGWADEIIRSFDTGITLLLQNGQGVLALVAQAISAARADITHIEMDEERASDTTVLRLLLNLRDRHHLAEVLRRLRRVTPVLRVSRTKA